VQLHYFHDAPYSSACTVQASGGSGAAVPPSVRLMQQNTRLIILTLEVSIASSFCSKEHMLHCWDITLRPVI